MTLEMDTPSPLEDMAVYWFANHITMRDGVTLRYGVYEAARPTRGRVLILIDRTEFIEKYSEVAEVFAAQGWQAWCLEWRDQGRREADHEHAHHTTEWFDTSLTDLEEFWRGVWLAEAETPTAILAHGVGGHLALRWLLKDKPRILPNTVLILSAPMIRPWSVSLFLRLSYCLAFLRCLGSYAAPYAGQERLFKRDQTFETNRLTQDKMQFSLLQKWYQRHQELAPAPQSWHWLYTALKSCLCLQRDLKTGGATTLEYWRCRYRLLRKAKGYHSLKALLQQDADSRKIRVPTLALLTPTDEVVDGASQYELAGRLKQGRILEFGEAKHDLLFEAPKIRKRVWKEIGSFLDKTFPATDNFTP